MTTKPVNNNELLVVGIASSAGGLTPLMEVISNAICHENMAFVLVPHLSRDHESALPQILSTVSDLRIQSIKDGMVIKPCHLYVLPPGFYARISENKFCLDPRPPRGINIAANVLFKSMAKAYGKNAIGVVLSGAGIGSDGSEGVVAIKQGLGHTYAQDPLSAEYPQMPQAAIGTGSVDLVLDPKQIGHDLTLVSWAT